MWKLILGAVLALPLTSSAAASAATVDVSITKTAYVPATASASTADTVKFTNNDTAAHQVAFKATSGVACSPSPFTLQPGQSGTCTFSAPGTYVLRVVASDGWAEAVKDVTVTVLPNSSAQRD